MRLLMRNGTAREQCETLSNIIERGIIKNKLMPREEASDEISRDIFVCASTRLTNDTNIEQSTQYITNNSHLPRSHSNEKY